MWLIIKDFRCYDAKIEESKKRSAATGSWLELPVLCHWAMATRQPPALTILYTVDFSSIWTWKLYIVSNFLGFHKWPLDRFSIMQYTPTVDAWAYVFARVSNAWVQLSRWLLALNLEEKQPTLMIYAGGLCGNELLRDIAKSSVGTVHNIWQKFEATGDISEAVTRERESASWTPRNSLPCGVSCSPWHVPEWVMHIYTLSYWNLSFQFNYLSCAQDAWLN